ncbi:nuclear pore complex protein Nup153-like isoform X2 [Lethenteron reissneri]|uniref:nuclear pore complex protein Nup153-like isoform X2 n=1 Tax=Lethenteron reissneri TaxID=7753 RepID=UPI002AB61C91|nr:nuclear pore complex protein Nup153-like isoform X2 [Lethenteron reissneri]
MKRKRPSAAGRSGAAKKSLVVQVTNGIRSRVGSWIQGIFRQGNDSESRVTWSDDSGSSCEEAEEKPASCGDPPSPSRSSSSSSPTQTNAHGASSTAEHRTPLGNDRPEHGPFREGFAFRGPTSPAKARLQKPPPARPCKDVATQYEEDDDMSSTSGFSSRHSDRDTVMSWTLKCEEAQRPVHSMTSASDTSRRKGSAAVHLSSKRLANECLDKQNVSYKRTRVAYDNPAPAFSSACAPPELFKTSSERPGRTEAAPCDVAQQAVRKILRSLETMSSPLADAKKIPLTASCIEMKNDRKHQSETAPAFSSPLKRLRIAGVSCSPTEHGGTCLKGLPPSETPGETRRERGAQRTPKRSPRASASSTHVPVVWLQPGTRSASSPGTLGRYCRPPLERAEIPAARGEQRVAAHEPSQQQTTAKSPPLVVAEARAEKEEQSERLKRTPERRSSGHFTAFLADDVNDLDDIEMEPPSNSQAFKNIDKGYMSGSSSTTSSSSSTPTKGLVTNASASTLVPASRSPTSSRLSEDAATSGAEGGDPVCPPADESKGKSSLSSESRAASAWECDTCLVWNSGRRLRCAACDVPLPSVLALRSMLVPRPSGRDASEKKAGAGAAGQGSDDRPDGPSTPGSTGLDSNTEGDTTSVEVASDTTQVEVNNPAGLPTIPPSSVASQTLAPQPGLPAGGGDIDAGTAGSSAASQTKASEIVVPGASKAAPDGALPTSVTIGHTSEPPNTAPTAGYCFGSKPITSAAAGMSFQFGIGGGGGGSQQPQPAAVSGLAGVAAAPKPGSGQVLDLQGDVVGKRSLDAASAAEKQTPQFSFGSSASGFKIDFSGLQQQGLGLSTAFRFGEAAIGKDCTDGPLGNPPASNTAAQPGSTGVASSSSDTKPNTTDGHQLAQNSVASSVNLPGVALMTNPSSLIDPSSAGIAAAAATSGSNTSTAALASSYSSPMPGLHAASAACSVPAPAAPGASSGISAAAPTSSAFTFTFESFTRANGKTDAAASAVSGTNTAPSTTAGSLFTFANTATANSSGGAAAAPSFVIGNPLGTLGGSGLNPTFSAASSAANTINKLSFAFGNPTLPTTSSTAVVAPTVAFGGLANGASASAEPESSIPVAAAASGTGNPFVFGVTSSSSSAAGTTVPNFTFGKSTAGAPPPASTSAGSALSGIGGNAAAPTLTFGQTAPPVAAPSVAASPFTFKGGAANAVATTAAPLFNFGAIRTSGSLATTNPSIFTFGSGSSAVRTSTTIAQAPIFSFGSVTSAATAALSTNAPPQGAAGVTMQPFQFGATATTAGTSAGANGGNFAFGGAPSGAAPAPTFAKPEAPASVFKFGASGAANSGGTQPAGFAFGTTAPSAVATPPTVSALSFGLQGGSKPEVAAGFSFGAAAPAPAPAQTAVPLFNFTNAESNNGNNNAGFRFPSNTNPAAFGAQPSSQPGFGQTGNPAPVFGSSPNPSPVFGQAANQTPAFGQATNQGLAFGQQANQAAMFGQATNQASAFGAAVSAFNQTANQNAAFASQFGQATNPPPAFNATPPTNNGSSPFAFGANQPTPQAFPASSRPTFTIGSAGSNRGNPHRRIRTARRRRDQNEPAHFH